MEMAIQKPEKFVLKPQREGGGTNRHITASYQGKFSFLHLGHNYFDDALKHKLLQLKESDERAAYILMDRINPPVQDSVIISSGRHYPIQTSSEIGVYGVFIR